MDRAPSNITASKFRPVNQELCSWQKRRSLYNYVKKKLNNSPWKGRRHLLEKNIIAIFFVRDTGKKKDKPQTLRIYIFLVLYYVPLHIRKKWIAVIRLFLVWVLFFIQSSAIFTLCFFFFVCLLKINIF